MLQINLKKKCKLMEQKFNTSYFAPKFQKHKNNISE